MALTCRILAGLFLLFAMVAVVTDVTRSSAAHALVITSLLEHWRTLAPQGLAAAQASARRVPLLWEVVIRPPLLIPAWALFGGLGLLFAWFGRRRTKVNIFAN
jgi:hypothetical protein